MRFRRRDTWRLVALGIGLTLFGCASTAGCRKEKPPKPHVLMTDRDGKMLRIAVEVVSRPEEQARGLMYRDRLQANTGMLFVYPVEQQRSFWMKNTYIPLDMIFIRADRKVAGIVHDTKPLTTDRREVDAPSQFVLEVNAGFAKRHGIRTGHQLEFKHVPGIEP